MTLVDQAAAILREESRPMHAAQIAARLREAYGRTISVPVLLRRLNTHLTHTRQVHFVRVERATFALPERAGFSAVCACGKAKRFDVPTCFRCETRDEGFTLADTLIAMGWGDKPQERIAQAVIDLARANPQRPEPREHWPADARARAGEGEAA